MAAAARRFVQNIATEHGYLGEEVYAKMDAETRRKVEEAFLRKDEMIGASVLTLAKNLYSKDVRFLFELLQNADDNNFSRALRAGIIPHVSFNIYKDRIVVDCNEDGFTEENLRAICNVGRSSKTGAQGYIGEKGIGFKSVFKVAWRVHIQSGYYSFTFTHRKGDSGMGMISPEWRNATEDLQGPLTRMTLYLHEDYTASGGNEQRQSILHQLNTLQPAMLLFLKKLKRISVRIFDDDGNETSSTLLFKSYPGQANRTVLERTHTEGGEVVHTKQRYHVVESIARNLPRNENREYTAQEESSRAYGSAPVILAFPLSNAESPLISPQEVFAFLPVRRVGFNFLIHSDFVTQANREDVVTSSSRNLKLLDAIADAFIVAVRGFCQHPMLKYQWMRYLPKLSADSWDPFWQKLVENIKIRVCDEEILALRSGTASRKISQTGRISSLMCDRHNVPLVDDLPGDRARYLSIFYYKGDLDLLQDYGLEYLSQAQFLARVRNDLSTPISKIRSVATSDHDWHARMARSLNRSFERGWYNRIADTKALELIPLIGGQWVSTINKVVYFAETLNGLRIPIDLGLKLVDPAAAKVPDRKLLFARLGVQCAEIKTIRSKILERYKSGGHLLDFEASLSHLEFLYLTHNSDHSLATYSGLELFDTQGKLYPIYHVFYVVDTARHSLWEIYNKVDADNLPHWPVDVHFMDKRYLDHTPSAPHTHDFVWEEWLHTFLGIRQYPRLFSPALFDSHASKLSEECQFVANYLPSELLGFLRYGWDPDIYDPLGERSAALGALRVPCRGGYSFRLSKTYLPSPEILKRCEEFMRPEERFPILDFGEEPSQLSQWDFLLELGVKSVPDLDFYLDTLFQIQVNYPNLFKSDLPDPSRILYLYLRIYMECSDSTDEETREARRSKTRDFFEEESVIFLPSWEDVDSDWVSQEECVLGAPISMASRYSILALYRTAFASSGLDFSNISKFLHDVLEIPKCSWNHIVEELTPLKIGVCDKAEVQVFYKCLNKMRISDDDLGNIKDAFQTDALILDDTCGQKWYNLSQCLWSAPTSIRGKINLSAIYDNEMESFFVGKLGVRMLDANVVYNELLELKQEDATVEHVRELLWTLNSQLELDAPQGSAEALLKLPILPVREIGGRVNLQSFDTEFAIIDRKPLGEIFGHRVKALDFNTNEVCQLRPFIKWAGLEHRYISRLVRETSGLNSGVKVPASDPMQDISKKAYALLRIAAHFNSPRVEGNGQELYDLLRQLRTWETDRISTTLVVCVDGNEVSEEVDRGEVHIDDLNGLEIYVPHDEKRRDDAYLSCLPNRLARWIMTDPATRTHRDVDPNVQFLIQGILLAKVSQLDKYLNEQGVIEAAIPEQTQEDDETDAFQFTPPWASTPTTVGPSTPPQLVSPPFEPSTPLSDREDVYLEQETPATDLMSSRTPSPDLMARNGSWLARASLSPQSHVRELFERQATRTQEYAALLSQVASAVRRSRLLDGPMSLFGLQDSLRDDSTMETKTFKEDELFGPDVPQFERDKKVGAAGELFVFELLSSMRPAARGFGRDNWTSTMRKYATAHPDYMDMDSWKGVETSDLQYEDDDNTLTEALIAKGHLHSRWRNSQPKFYIEVKTTPGPWDAPFYMSHAQWLKMKTLSTDDSVYVIFRVHNLYSDRIGLNIYVDPAQLAEEGRLVFGLTVKPLSR
ncbi:hypothetical protein F5Y05DRAFT_386264 [Hypoxylon sp. FL0543]|nr:hypothetical protein F5Y05DRAFT_386264 [Hypoxylon sp. FL0543]